MEHIRLYVFWFGVRLDNRIPTIQREAAQAMTQNQQPQTPAADRLRDDIIAALDKEGLASMNHGNETVRQIIHRVVGESDWLKELLRTTAEQPQTREGGERAVMRLVCWIFGHDWQAFPSNRCRRCRKRDWRKP